MTFVRLAVEGPTDVPVAERILRDVDLQPTEPIITRGKTRLDALIPALNGAATGTNWLILRDLDHDAHCPPALIPQLLAGRSRRPRLSLRIPVRAIESWLLADAEAFGSAFSIPGKHIPERPDELDHPKRSLINACRRSRRHDVRRAMIPRPRSGRQVGPQYTSQIVQFTVTQWDPVRAATRSPSLARAGRLPASALRGNLELIRTRPRGMSADQSA